MLRLPASPPACGHPSRSATYFTIRSLRLRNLRRGAWRLGSPVRTWDASNVNALREIYFYHNHYFYKSENLVASSSVSSLPYARGTFQAIPVVHRKQHKFSAVHRRACKPERGGPHREDNVAVVPSHRSGTTAHRWRVHTQCSGRSLVRSDDHLCVAQQHASHKARCQ